MMTEKRFFTHENMVSDTEMIIPVTVWSNKEQQQKYCDELNAMDNTINNLSEHLENTIRDNTHKTIAIGKLYEENEKLKKFKKQTYSIINNKINELAMITSYGDVHNDLRVFAQRVLIDVKKEFDNPTYENKR